jgi:hypothetical protein
MVEIIAPQGKICLIDDVYGPLDLRMLQPKSITVVFENVFTRPNFQTADMLEQHHLLSIVAELVDTGVIQTTLIERLSPGTCESGNGRDDRKTRAGAIPGLVVMRKNSRVDFRDRMEYK